MAQNSTIISTFFSCTPHLVDNTEFLIKPRFKDKSFLHQKYVVERLSISQIALETFSARSTIRRALDCYDIPIRNDRKANDLCRGQIGYGLRMQDGKLVKHKGELDVITNMRSLRGQGYSYRKIAEILNSLNIPTKSKKSGWKAPTVMKILKNHG